MQRVGVRAAARAEPLHRSPAERRQRQPVMMDARHDPEQTRQRARLVVAEGEHQDGRQHLDPACGVGERVERGIVGPVDVLDDEQRRRLARELAEQRGEHVGGAGKRNGVAQRAERTRRAQIVARREQHARVASAANVRTRLVLPIPASPATSTTAPRPARRLPDRVMEHAESLVTLEHVRPHRSIVPRAGAPHPGRRRADSP